LVVVPDDEVDDPDPQPATITAAAIRRSRKPGSRGCGHFDETSTGG
jgi:hypothetical protein